MMPISNKHSLVIHGHRTSVTLEPEFWEALDYIAATEKTSITALITHIDDTRITNLSSAIRVYVLTYFRSLHKV